MRYAILLIALIFTHGAAADQQGSVSTSIFLAVNLEPRQATVFEYSSCGQYDAGNCEENLTEYAIEQSEDQLKVSIKPVVRVTVEPI